MIALFLGELFRFPLGRRIVLLGGGVALAFACNVGRALALVWIYAHGGEDGLARHHDQVGLAVLAASLAGLGRARLCSPALARSPGPAAPEGAAGPWCRAAVAPGRDPRCCSPGWLALVETGTEIWYRIHDPSDAKAISWTVDFPAQRPASTRPPSRRSRRRCCVTTKGVPRPGRTSDGDYWSMVFLRWFPGRASVQLARSHGPEICLPASGMTLRSDLGVDPLPVQGRELATHSYIFTLRRADPVCLLLPGGGSAAGRRARQHAPTHDLLSAAWTAVWAGRRNRGQQVLEVVVAGPANAEDARAATIRMLERCRPAFRFGSRRKMTIFRAATRRRDCNGRGPHLSSDSVQAGQ